MTHPTIPAPEHRRADELKPGDWVVALLDSNSTSPDRRNAEVLAAFPYDDGMRSPKVLLVVKDADVSSPETARLFADDTVRLLTTDELAAIREQAKRSQKIADIRAFADFLERNPWAPLPYENAQADIAYDEIGAYAERVGVPVDTRLDDRTQVRHRIGGIEYSVIAWHRDGRPAEPAPVEASPGDDLGFGYSRELDDDPQVIRPHSPRVPLHTGAVVDGGVLVDETPDPNAACAEHDDDHLGTTCPDIVAKLVDETPVEHYEASIRTGPTGIGDSGATCACGTDVGGFDTVAEAQKQLAFHIEAATSSTGLTKAADQLRGPLAGMTPVVTYFTVGHDYVTVAAPTYDGCREAMFAKYGNRWGLSYLAGMQRATDVVRGKFEREVIVAPGTDEALAKSALKAAGDLLYGAPNAEAR